MNEIHVVYKRIGGVGHIAKLLEERGATVRNADLRSLLLDIDKSNNKYYFHQPKSHLCCLILSLVKPKRRADFCCVLHESSHYNLDANNVLRGILGYLIRMTVVRFCFYLGVEIRGVSEFVCNSYFLAHKGISYLPLFRESLEMQALTLPIKTHSAVVWLRRGTAIKSLHNLIRLHSAELVSSVFAFGDPIEVSLFKRQINNSAQLIHLDLISTTPRVPETEFLAILKNARWFISMYSREGFGLSVFQAMYFGCIVICERAGALPEWLPEANFDIAFRLLSAQNELTDAEIERVSQLNHKCARRCLSDEN